MNPATTNLLFTASILMLTTTTAMANTTGITADKKDGLITVKSAEGKTILVYRGEPGGMPEGFDPAFLRGGYIAQVHTPSGTLVSDDYPPDHKHHHGIWSPWTKTKFEGRPPDFWNMGQKTGTVEPVSFGDVWHKDGAAGFRARHRMIDLSAKPQAKVAIDETWEVTVHPPTTSADGKVAANVFDLTITQTTSSDSPLTLPKYHYGGLGFRGHREWNGKANCRILTSEGLTDRLKANETRAKWAYVGGDVAGKPAGIAILCHPGNFRAPQPIRIHPTEPFFCYAPSQLGEWKIEPGKPYVARYRFVVTDGPPDAKEIERRWAEYAKEAKGQVGDERK